MAARDCSGWGCCDRGVRVVTVSRLALKIFTSWTVLADLDPEVAGSAAHEGGLVDTRRVQLWASRHLHTELVALSVAEQGASHPGRVKGLPRQVRVVDRRTAEVAEALARDLAATAKAAGKALEVDLDDLVECAQAKLAGTDRPD